ncbi:hypothetical protein ACHAXH_008854 [Discostella pseudostelligera]
MDPPNYYGKKRRSSSYQQQHHLRIDAQYDDDNYDGYVFEDDNGIDDSAKDYWRQLLLLPRTLVQRMRMSMLNPTQCLRTVNYASSIRTKIIVISVSIAIILHIIAPLSSSFTFIPKHDDDNHALGDSSPQIDSDGKYHGRYPNSLLTLFYPLTLYRDVVLDQPIDITDVPFFWHPNVVDEMAVKNALRKCYKAEIIELNTIEEIENAKENNLIMRLVSRNRVGEGSVDPVNDGENPATTNVRLYNGQRRQPVVIASPHIRRAAELFTHDYSGRVFAFYRHPYDYDLHPSLQAIREEEMYDANDFLTRLLASVPHGPLDLKELGIAKHVVRQATVAGTADLMAESIVRIGKYFGWVAVGGLGTKESVDSDDTIARTCIENVVKDVPGEKFIDRTDESGWEEFYKANRFDCELYEVARSTWRAQIQTIIPLILQKVRAGEGDEDKEKEGDEED